MVVNEGLMGCFRFPAAISSLPNVAFHPPNCVRRRRAASELFGVHQQARHATHVGTREETSACRESKSVRRPQPIRAWKNSRDSGRVQGRSDEYASDFSTSARGQGQVAMQSERLQFEGCVGTLCGCDGAGQDLQVLSERRHSKSQRHLPMAENCRRLLTASVRGVSLRERRHVLFQRWHPQS